MPVDVDLASYVAGGYWLVRPVQRPLWADAHYVADPVISCSGCLLGGGAGPHVPWIGPTEEQLASLGVDPDSTDELLSLGVAREDRAAARAWVADHDRLVDFEHTWSTPEPLLEFAERFLPPRSVMVVGVALRVDLAFAWTRNPSDAMEMLLATGQPPAAGGTPLGWEPVEWLEQGVACSWTCNGLQKMVAERAELRLNEHGLLPDQEHTIEVMEIVEQLPKEDGAWEAFLLLRYGPEPQPPFRELPPAVGAVPAQPAPD